MVLGYTRLVMIFFAYIFSMLYENMSGCLRCFGISIIPAVLTVLGLCGVRIFRIIAVFSNLPGDFNGISGQSVGNGTADSDDTCSLQAFTESGNKGL